ncbi:PAS domain-containing protein [Streptomyces albidoflavus]
MQIDSEGAVSAWNDDAQELFGYPAKQITGKPLTDYAAWPHTPGTSTGIAEALRLSRWEGSYGIRAADGRVVPVYASHLRVRDPQGAPSTVCLLVRDDERAVLATPQRGTAPESAHRADGQSTDPFETFIGSPAPDDLDGLLQRTVERSRDMLDGDAAFLLLATDDETELEVRATTGLPSARQRFARVPGRHRLRPVRHGPDARRPRGPERRAGRRAAAERHRDAVGGDGPAQGRGPPDRFPRRRRGGRGPLLQRGGAAPAVRRRPDRAGRRVGPPR